MPKKKQFMLVAPLFFLWLAGCHLPMDISPDDKWKYLSQRQRNRAIDDYLTKGKQPEDNPTLIPPFYGSVSGPSLHSKY